MKTVTWIGPQRELCGYGIGNPGKDITLPDHVADSYMKQGLAKETVTETTNDLTQEESNDGLQSKF